MDNKNYIILAIHNFFYKTIFFYIAFDINLLVFPHKEKKNLFTNFLLKKKKKPMTIKINHDKNKNKILIIY